MHDIKNNSKLVYIIYNVRYSSVKKNQTMFWIYVNWGGDDTIVGTNTETKVRVVSYKVMSSLILMLKL